MNILALLMVILFSILVGYLIQSVVIKQKNKKILRLEKEMLQAHAEILTAQKEYCDLEIRLRDMQIPVISMIKIDGEEKIVDKEDASGLRKKRSNRTA
jgi:hypothetical protein